MKTPDDYRPLFEGMTEMDFNSLMQVAKEWAYKNKVEFEGTSGSVDELTDDLQCAEDKIIDLKNEITHLKDKIKESVKSLVNI